MNNAFLFTDLTKKALVISFKAHKEQVDKAGIPYVYHPFLVANGCGSDEYAICVALLHDVFEDSKDESLKQEIRTTFPKEIIDALNLLNHNKKDDYLNVYIPRIKQNELAKKVKLSDLENNMNLNRLDTITFNDILRVAKYKEAKLILTTEYDKTEYYPIVYYINNQILTNPNLSHYFLINEEFEICIKRNSTTKEINEVLNLFTKYFYQVLFNPLFTEIIFTNDNTTSFYDRMYFIETH
jgi:hypothetical protein